MAKKFEIIKNCPLFNNVREEDLARVYDCLGGHIVRYTKNQMIFEEGEPARYICMVISGSVQVVRDDYNGNRVIINRLRPSDIFAEAVSITDNTQMPVSIVAGTDCEVLMIESRCVLNPCCRNCHFHINLIKNLLNVISLKNIWLTQRVEVTSRRTTRDKLMAFLLMSAKQYGSKEFTIPFNRQELADFLGVERSAMSAEIGRLKADGVIDTRRSWFRVL